ncbi:MAG: putative alpha-ketoglutarate permease transrane protein [Acidobacteriota bacterium]
MNTDKHGSPIRSIVGGTIGNLVEWYDWLVYSSFSLYFAKAFFPQGNQTAQLLNTAAVFAVGYFMRPIGGLLLGSYADKHGRKAALTLSVLLMCGGSLAIAITPGYSSIGFAAPVILVLARMLQGISVGGEYGTSAVYLSEIAEAKWRGYYSSFQYVTLQGGQLLATFVLVALQQVFLTAEELDAWGWRIPFFIGAGLAVVAMWLRRALAETEAFERTERGSRGSIGQLLKGHMREVWTVMGLTLGGTVAFYAYTVYMQKFLVNTGGISKSASSLITAATLLFLVLLQPLAGALSDVIGRRPLLIGFGVLGSLFTVPIMQAISTTQDFWVALGLVMICMVILSGYTAVNAAVKAELFPTEVRALGVGLPYGIVVALGGSTEYIGLQFKQAGHEPWFYWYLSATMFVSLLVYVFVLPETRGKDLR